MVIHITDIDSAIQQAEGNLREAKHTLIRTVQGEAGNVWELLAHATNSVAAAEGAYAALVDAGHRYRAYTEPGSETRRAEEIGSLATHLLLNPPHDTSSGRTNDARRAYNDGIREAARALIEWADSQL